MEHLERHTHEQKTNFEGLGIDPMFLGILGRLGFRTPTPIQSQAIPFAIEGKDLVGIAQTGTGKTLAFGIPMLQRITRQQAARGLVVVPTRELALQVDKALQNMGRSANIRTAVLIGGASMSFQIRDIGRNPHVIIATPGRLIDHLRQRTLTLHTVGIVVLDEADRMLDMGFAPQIAQIFSALPKERQMMLFSATMPSEIMKIASSHMRLPVRVEIAPTGTTAEHVTQELFIVPKMQKLALLRKLLEQYRGSTLVFGRTKYGAKKITRQLQDDGTRVAEIHSNRSLAQRREALEGFRSGRYRVLVATDIASRGIDVSGIELVINFDLPSTSDDYVHRIGRTARAGASGHAVTFAMPSEFREVRDIERLIRKNIPVSKLPELPDIPTETSATSLNERFRSRSGRSARPFSRYGHTSRKRF